MGSSDRSLLLRRIQGSRKLQQVSKSIEQPVTSVALLSPAHIDLQQCQCSCALLRLCIGSLSRRVTHLRPDLRHRSFYALSLNHNQLQTLRWCCDLALHDIAKGDARSSRGLSQLGETPAKAGLQGLTHRAVNIQQLFGSWWASLCPQQASQAVGTNHFRHVHWQMAPLMPAPTVVCMPSLCGQPSAADSC